MYPKFCLEKKKKFDWDQVIYNCLIVFTFIFIGACILVPIFGCGWLMWITTELVGKIH